MNPTTLRSQLFFLLLLLFQIHTNGQQQYESGYIITEEKDTIQGLVRNTIDQDLANEIHFKKESATSPTIYKPEEIRGFGFEMVVASIRKKLPLRTILSSFLQRT